MDNAPSFDQIEDASASQDPASSPPAMPAAPPNEPQMPQSFDSIDEAPKFDDIQEASTPNPFSTPEQQAATAVEGALKGATFGLSTKAETSLGVDPEAIKARQEANPLIALGSETAGTIGSAFIPGVGEGWILGKVGSALVPIAKEANIAAKAGRMAVRGMIEMGSMAAGDELSDAFLGKGHDVDAVAGHIVTAGGIGLLTGGLIGAGGAKLEALQDQKYGHYLDNFAVGLGNSASGAVGDVHSEAITKMLEDAGEPIPKGMKDGQKFAKEFSNITAKEIAKRATELTSAKVGAMVGGGVIGAGVGYKIAEKYLDPMAEKLASKIAPTVTKKVMVPIMLKALSMGQSMGLTNALNYGSKAAAGTRVINNAIDSLFKVGSEKALEFGIDQNDNEKLDQYIKNGGINQQIDQFKQEENVPNYAEGGKVVAKPLSSDGLSRLYPEQHNMLTTAKGRVSNYLNSLRPVPSTNKMMFDSDYEDPMKKRTYDSALTVANSPLSVLKHVQNGTLQAEHVKHLTSMYPEVHDHLSKKLTDRLVTHQVEDKKPSYKMRQSLSLFLGSALDSTMTPMSIQAAQSVFMPAQPPQQPQKPGKNKKGTASLNKVSEDYQTPEQAREKRMSKD